MSERPNTLKALVGPLAPNTTIRILLGSDRKWQSPLWLGVGPDASVYIGTGLSPGSLIREVPQPAPVENPGARLLAFEAVSNAQPKGIHVSFHPSGAINAGGGRFRRAPWQQLVSNQLLCQLLFEHPSAFRAVSSIRKRDIRLNYEINEHRPLYGELHVAPLEAPVPFVGGTDSVITIRLESNFPARPPIAVQLALGELNEGYKWAPATLVLWHAPRQAA